jgi:transcriptional regulator with XRE-family HTH domain
VADYYQPELNESNGRYKPDGALIRQLRIKMGWTVAQLAEKVPCSTGTIMRLEKGESAYAATLAKVGAVLGRKFSALLLNREKPEGKMPDTSVDPEQLSLGGIELSPDLNKFDQTAQLRELIKALATALKTKSAQIYVINITSGSTIIELRMPRKALIRMLRLYIDGKLMLPTPVRAVHIADDVQIPINILPDLVDRIECDYGLDGTIRVARRQGVRSK